MGLWSKIKKAAKKLVAGIDKKASVKPVVKAVAKVKKAIAVKKKNAKPVLKKAK